MKVKDLLEIQSTIEKRKTPCDMNGDLNQHFSVSKEEYIDILRNLLTAFNVKIEEVEDD